MKLEKSIIAKDASQYLLCINFFSGGGVGIVENKKKKNKIRFMNSAAARKRISAGKFSGVYPFVVVFVVVLCAGCLCCLLLLINGKYYY